MKRLVLALTIVALVLPAVPRAQAADLSVDFFYNNLSGGSWIEVAAYGYCWQPDVAISAGWRPYSDGYWAYTTLGWTWISYEDFGWATYHYGRWVRLAGRGWVWVPGRDEDLEWGPAWVSWRTGGDYIGWAPLPPRIGISYGHRTIFGRVDIEFDIGPDYYNFVDVRYIGEPVLRDRIYQSSQNVTYINQTVNVTNITYKDNRVYNYGPDYNTLSARSSRPIQRLELEQQTNVDPSVAAKSGALTKVEGGKLIVAAPTTIKKSAQPIAPPTVKEKIAEAKVDKGWAGVSDPKAQEDLKKKMQTEDNKKIPPPSTGASAAAQAGASVAATASPAASGASASPALSPELGKPGKGNRGELQNVPSPPGGLSPATEEATGPGGKSKGKSERGNLGPTPSTEGSAELPAGKGKARQFEPAGTPMGRGKESPEGGASGAEKRKGQGASVQSPVAPTSAGSAAPEGGKGKAAPEGGKGKKGEKSPPPTP